jgi:hypothetical protein
MNTYVWMNIWMYICGCMTVYIYDGLEAEEEDELGGRPVFRGYV